MKSPASSAGLTPARAMQEDAEPSKDPIEDVQVHGERSFAGEDGGYAKACQELLELSRRPDIDCPDEGLEHLLRTAGCSPRFPRLMKFIHHAKRLLLRIPD